MQDQIAFRMGRALYMATGEDPNAKPFEELRPEIAAYWEARGNAIAEEAGVRELAGAATCALMALETAPVKGTENYKAAALLMITLSRIGFGGAVPGPDPVAESPRLAFKTIKGGLS